MLLTDTRIRNAKPTDSNYRVGAGLPGARSTAQPTTWTLFFTGLIASVRSATALTLVVPRLYPWGSEKAVLD